MLAMPAIVPDPCASMPGSTASTQFATPKTFTP